MGGETYRCFSHPERLAIGRCNDCGESFCGECLHVYNLNAEGARAILYLCPNCLRRRHIEKTDVPIYLGILFLLFGIITAIGSLPFGALMVLIGAGAIIYGIMRGKQIREEIPEETTIDELQVEKKKRKTELASIGEDIDAEEVYNKLLSKYVNRWGVRTGMELLENEIMAYTRHGVSFSEAVKKIYQRQGKRT